MFRFFKRVKDPKSSLLLFLEEADEALIRAYETKQIAGFTKYASNEVLRFISEKLNSEKPRLFGTKNYRTRNWTILSNQESMIRVKKELRHSHVKLNKGIYVAIGEDVDEFWEVHKISIGFQINMISEVS